MALSDGCLVPEGVHLTVGLGLAVDQGEGLQLLQSLDVALLDLDELQLESVVKVHQLLVRGAHHPVLAQALDRLLQRLLPLGEDPPDPGLRGEKDAEESLAGGDEGSTELPPHLPNEPVFLRGKKSHHLPNYSFWSQVGRRSRLLPDLVARKKKLSVERLQDGERVRHGLYEEVCG